MMAALTAAANGAQVTLYEKNEKLGKKIYITGKGRCNVTNACEVETLFSNVIRNPRFLYSAFYGFDNEKTQQFFQAQGCALKTERGERVFPVSDHASDVIRALERALQEKKVQIRLRTRVERILTGQPAREDAEEADPAQLRNADKAGKKKKRKQTSFVCGVQLADGTKEPADAVILATGGLSYPTTGSDGEGLRMAAKLGHTVIPCYPSLVPFEVAEEWCSSLQGLALKNVEITLCLDEKELYSGFGEMLFTHFGVSGPLILSASSYYGQALAKRAGKAEKAGKAGKSEKAEKAEPSVCRLYLNLKPALTQEQLDRRLLRDFDTHKNKSFKNALDGLFPARLIPVMIGLSGIDPEKKVHEVTKAERRQFAELIRHLPLTVTGTRDFKEAIITAGGVKVQEVNPSTMESRLIGGLYFAGEMLDVDALTGGFNLQIAWSTGHLAGEGAAVRQETPDRNECLN